MSWKHYKPKAVKRRLKNAFKTWRFEKSLPHRDDLMWQKCPPCKVGLYDAGSATIGKLLYVVGGYTQLSNVSNCICIFDLESETWGRTIPLPPNVPESHCAIESDGQRYIYFVSGQLGPECSPAVKSVFSYDTQTDAWRQLPPIPQARYAGTARLWQGRLHFVGGAREDRWTACADHWSLGVQDGEACDASWRTHAPIPVPAMHRASIVVDDALYVIGGQQGDFVAIDGDPNCKCTGLTPETYTGSCLRLSAPDGDWEQLADLHIPTSHIDFSIIEHNGDILIFGGQVYKSLDNFHLRLTDLVQAYSTAQDRWRIAGHFPHHLKLPSIAKWNGHIYVTGGQRGVGGSDLPGPISNQVWKAPLDGLAQARDAKSSAFFKGKKIVMLSHELTHSGAPLLLIETAQMLMDAGATVKFASFKGKKDNWTLACDKQMPVVSMASVASHVASADFLIANTVSENVMSFVGDLVAQDSTVAAKLVCWVHEIDVERYLPQGQNIKDSALALFGSEASHKAWIDSIGELPNTAVIHPPVDDQFLKLLEQPKLAFPRIPDRRRPTDSIAASRAEVRSYLGVADDDFLILCIGNIEARKGQKLLLETIARLAPHCDKPIKLCLVGFHGPRQRKKFLKKLTPDERVVLSPERAYIWQSDIAAFYRAADAFVMNSQGDGKLRGECFGRVTTEAMAAGAVVLGTSAGGTQEIIEHGVSGYLFPVGASGQEILAQKIEYLTKNPKVAQTLAKAGRDRVEDAFNQTRFLTSLEAEFAKRL
jgi:glycosyltransferase involved in cell wall biosynthesis